MLWPLALVQQQNHRIVPIFLYVILVLLIKGGIVKSGNLNSKYYYLMLAEFKLFLRKMQIVTFFIAEP
jgi:hypothetical protein